MLIWLYDDEGVGARGLAQTQSALERYWGATVVRVNAAQIKAGIVADGLVIGGGADLPYCRQLNGAGTAEIKRFVAAGGFYIGICAGAYFAAQQVDFQGEGYKVYGSRELGFFKGVARGSLPQFVESKLYDLTDNSRAWLTLPEFPAMPMVYHGGCAFVGEAEKVVAHYPSALPLVAMVAGHYGRGAYFLSGVHFEALDDGAVFFAKLRAIIGTTLNH